MKWGRGAWSPTRTAWEALCWRTAGYNRRTPLQPAPSKHPFFPQDVAHTSLVLGRPQSSPPHSCSVLAHCPTHVVPASPNPGFQSKDYAFFTFARSVWHKPGTQEAINKYLLNEISKIKTSPRQILHSHPPLPYSPHTLDYRMGRFSDWIRSTSFGDCKFSRLRNAHPDSDCSSGCNPCIHFKNPNTRKGLCFSSSFTG